LSTSLRDAILTARFARASDHRNRRRRVDAGQRGPVRDALACSKKKAADAREQPRREGARVRAARRSGNHSLGPPRIARGSLVIERGGPIASSGSVPIRRHEQVSDPGQMAETTWSFTKSSSAVDHSRLLEAWLQLKSQVAVMFRHLHRKTRRSSRSAGTRPLIVAMAAMTSTAIVQSCACDRLQPSTMSLVPRA